MSLAETKCVHVYITTFQHNFYKNTFNGGGKAVSLALLTAQDSAA